MVAQVTHKLGTPVKNPDSLRLDYLQYVHVPAIYTKNPLTLHSGDNGRTLKSEKIQLVNAEKLQLTTDTLRQPIYLTQCT